jgi:hypothetical protein
MEILALSILSELRNNERCTKREISESIANLAIHNCFEVFRFICKYKTHTQYFEIDRAAELIKKMA